jgi:hypothetical protein
MPAKSDKERLELLISIFNKEIYGFGARLANAVPANSFIRSDLFARLLGPFTAFLEHKEERVSSTSGAFIGKTVDLITAFATTLTQASGAGAVSREQWVEDLIRDAAARIRSADDPEAEVGKIKREFELRTSLLEFISQKSTSQTSEQQASSFVKDLGRLWNSFQAATKTSAKKLDDAGSNLAPHVGKLADWLENKRGGRR